MSRPCVNVLYIEKLGVSLLRRRRSWVWGLHRVSLRVRAILPRAGCVGETAVEAWLAIVFVAVFVFEFEDEAGGGLSIG